MQGVFLGTREGMSSVITMRNDTNAAALYVKLASFSWSFPFIIVTMAGLSVLQSCSSCKETALALIRKRISFPLS